MNMYNSLFSPIAMLNEQVARHVFETIFEQGPLVVIKDADGNCWPSNSQKFESLNLSKQWLTHFCSKINDGVEPLVSHIQNHGIVGSQLVGDHTKCGYILMAMEEPGPESMLAKMELVEMILNQFNLIAKLIEKCNSLYQTQAKLCSPLYSN
jgi:hypothetical protein